LPAQQADQHNQQRRNQRSRRRHHRHRQVLASSTSVDFGSLENIFA